MAPLDESRTCGDDRGVSIRALGPRILVFGSGLKWDVRLFEEGDVDNQLALTVAAFHRATVGD